MRPAGVAGKCYCDAHDGTGTNCLEAGKCVLGGYEPSSPLDAYELIVYDCEVFAHDWLFVFKRAGRYERFWNDPEGVREFMEEHGDAVLVGFNSKHYDQYILKAVLAGCGPEEVKEVNDWIIGTDNQPWEHPYLQGFWCPMNNADLMDDTQQGTSLKSIEGHLGMGIEESSVPFDIETPLTPQQRREVEHYCRHDVDATEELLRIRRGYLETKLHLAGLAGIDPLRALGMTDPKLAAALFKATPIETRDERDYEFPERLDYDLIPAEVMEFFGRIRDASVGDEELFRSTLKTEIGGCPVVYAFGGIHGAVPKHRERAGDGRLILNYDVSSLYPSLMIEYGYVSRAVPDPAIFEGIRNERFEAKRRGDKQTANALKSPMNKAYGAMGNQYNAMYDPKMKLSVCVSGQLSITALAMAYARIPGLRIIQLNTDGIMVSVPEEGYAAVVEANERWQRQTALELEEDRIEFVWQKDVNNYALRKTDGTEKVKGGYLVRGISPIGAWSVNNNATVVADALRRWLLDGIPVAETIEACDDPAAFQMIAKAGHKYSRVYQLVSDGEGGWREEDRQKCNRVFAGLDPALGRLYKVKAADGSVAKIESLPERCLLANGAFPLIAEIDKSFYTELAERRARDFEEKEDEEMTETTTSGAKAPAAKRATATKAAPKASVYKKLADARKMFAEAGVTKSGVNPKQGYDYFELEDIVPVQTRIFAELGLIELFTYHGPEPIVIHDIDGKAKVEWSEPSATATVVNLDDPDDRIEFRLKWSDMNPITSNATGKAVNQPIQDTGAEQTYMRRYLKMQVLDIVEADAVDSGEAAKPAREHKEKAPSASAPAKKPATRKKPATEAERKTAAKEITNPDGPATKLQVKSLARTMKELRDEHGDEHPEVAQFIAELSAATGKLEHSAGDSGKPFTRAECADALVALGKMREEFESGKEA
jgi:hypothetical protein